MSYGEAPESVKYHGGYDPADPPQGEYWCSECGHWDDDCTCDTEEEQTNPIPTMKTDTEETKQWYALSDGQEIVQTKLMTPNEFEAAQAEAEKATDGNLSWGYRPDIISIQYGGIEITYNEKDNDWRFTLRGKERRAETLLNAQKAIDAPPPPDKKPFKKFEAYLRTGYGTGSELEKVTVTGIVWSKWRSDQVYIKRHNANPRYGRGRRESIYLSSLLEVTPENEALVAEISKLAEAQSKLSEQMEKLGEKLTPISKEKMNLEDYD